MGLGMKICTMPDTTPKVVNGKLQHGDPNRPTCFPNDMENQTVNNSQDNLKNIEAQKAQRREVRER